MNDATPIPDYPARVRQAVGLLAGPDPDARAYLECIAYASTFVATFKA